MHDNSIMIMSNLFARYTSAGNNRVCYDVGSFDVNGTYRDLVEGHGWDYVGLDICPGPNVNFVVPERGEWALSQQADLVISGQCIEHTSRPWEWILNVAGLMAPGGLLFLIAPSSWPQHRYPIDCWRFLPDGIRSLAELASSTVREVDLAPCLELGPGYEDCYAVLQKGGGK